VFGNDTCTQTVLIKTNNRTRIYADLAD